MAWTAADIPDLTGRVAVVTGANGGLGLETAKALAGAGAHVVMAARDQAKAATAQSEILAVHPEALLEVVELDLADLSSVATAAQQISAVHEQVDILVNNAGLMAMPERKTKDGFEMQLGVNHLGHFALSSQLLPGLLRAERARVVTVTSTVHHFGRPIDPANPHLEGSYQSWKAYGQSKLANYHFALGLDERFRAAGVAAQSLVAHPGLTYSDLQVHAAAEGGAGRTAGFWVALARHTGMTTEAGARPQLRAATDPGASGGQMYAPRFVQNGPAVRRPILRRVGFDDAVRTLWEVSERETGVTLDVFAVAESLRS
ncbi:MAG TPA: oxidoreductase [Polyangia bacterium]|nr:oxidoreductase [Polyangia bacterium]